MTGRFPRTPSETRHKPVRKNRPDRVNRRRPSPRFRSDGWVERAYDAATIGALFLLLLLAAHYLPEGLARFPLFSLTEVRVEGGVTFDAARVLGLGGIELGDSLLAIDPVRLARRLASEAWLRKVSARRAWPHGLSIRIEERRAVAAIDTGEELRLIDEQGAIFLEEPERRNFADLPRIVGEVARLESERPQLLPAIVDLVGRLHAFLPRHGEAYTLHLDRRGALTILDRGRGYSIYLGEGVFGRKLERLEHLLPKLEKEAPDFEFIDLSFDRRVVVRRKGAG